ncbi:MAG: class II aldolase/adducin family protein [Acidobacteria bacterium]|nr:class II aldolase/adducin family protein [Acidobacteriota bacterium]
MYESERQQIIDAGIALDRYRLISLSGGNASMRIGGHILVTPSGMSYETLVPADVVVMDPKGKVIEGERRPSVDTVALLHIYNNMPGVNAVIHTHQPYATAIGLVLDELPAFCTTLVNATLGAVKVAPYSSAASLDMGVKTVENIGDMRAVILRNHGVVTVGPTLKDALYAAVYLEDAARSYSVARSMGTPRLLTKEQVEEAVESFRHYGQGKK